MNGIILLTRLIVTSTNTEMAVNLLAPENIGQPAWIQQQIFAGNPEPELRITTMRPVLDAFEQMSVEAYAYDCHRDLEQRHCKLANIFDNS